MNTTRANVSDVVLHVLTPIKQSGPAGTAAADAYLAVQRHFASFRQFQSLMQCLVMAGTVQFADGRYFSTTSARDLIVAIEHTASLATMACE